jgi:hypothetical protein
MSSKLHIGSKIYDYTTGVEQGTILHDGTYTATTTPASTDTLLIKQSGVQKQITYANLTAGLGGGGELTYTLLATLNSVSTFNITTSNGLDSVLVFVGYDQDFRMNSITLKLEEVPDTSSTKSAYVISIGGAIGVFKRSVDGTQIVVSSLSPGTYMKVFELGVA